MAGAKPPRTCGAKRSLAAHRKEPPPRAKNRRMIPAAVSRRSVLAASAALLSPCAFATSAPAAIADYERATGGRVGFHALNLASRQQIAWRANERFAMCSTFKASLAGFVLARVDAGRERLARRIGIRSEDILEYAPAAKAHLAQGAMTVDALCEAAVVLSDNTCANLLLRESGGPPALTKFWRTLGDHA